MEFFFSKYAIIFHIFCSFLGMSHDEMASIMGEWNKGELDSFLIEISANILKYKDTDGEPLVEKIRDAAGQKGTGKWTAISALGKKCAFKKQD